MSKHSVLPTNHQGQCQGCQSHPRDPTLSGHDAEAFINKACAILRSIYGLTPDNHPDPRLCSDPPPVPLGRTQGLYFPEPLATRQPTVSWYIANLSYYARASAGVFYTALEYLERAKPRFRPVPGDPRTAFVGALILAHRFLEDGSYRTETWARLTGSSSRMISACIEAMFDALEHRLWIGPLPEPNDNRMFSMREGTIFSEEMLGGQRRCSLPSLSVLYGARSVSTTARSSSRSFRAFGDPQSIPSAAESTQPIAGPSNASSVPVTKPVQGLPSPPASPSSSSNTPPPRVAHTSQKVPYLSRRSSYMHTSLSLPPPEKGLFNFSQWQAADQFGAAPSSTGPSYTAPLPPAPLPPTQRPHPHLPPPLVFMKPASIAMRAHESPVFSVAQWCAPIPELAEDSTSEMEVEHEVKTTPPRTPCDSTSGSDPDAFNPSMWAAQASLFPPSTAVLPQMSLATPAPTVKVESPEKKMRYPSATLVPPSSCLDPAWNGRRHSIAVTGTRY
ncbi:unnamed protein product [Rhizoctonia solani]|uniref:G1 s-specific cyclin n=1 Tax=Rhizoctonia solani TaxID=456999 RepID=A0A8H7H8B3_9AGAM|nr:uncharacterized protein RhiXN_07367 [Rhizoctonia solani]KAF8678826.1 g1 s-specific cyclin [Rhizoctonia solani]QRW25418.1 hypothetical protein RhiXN_07367 [Rhizoctonia solani]CAE6476819.1 unnamed protein product [Rhizoctonia solani]